jgi:hypothetical protein
LLGKFDALFWPENKKRYFELVEKWYSTGF